jgi:hypothetical protein
MERFTNKWHQRIFDAGIGAAEAEYVRALERGMVDPVVELIADHDESGAKVAIVVREREELAGVLDRVCKSAAETLRKGPREGCSWTVLVEDAIGVKVVDRPAPRDWAFRKSRTASPGR